MAGDQPPPVVLLLAPVPDDHNSVWVEGAGVIFEPNTLGSSANSYKITPAHVLAEP
jgi:hypothetical protein